MAEHLTEEEQIETLKRWWSENGKSTIVGVVLAVSGYLGWGGWQAQQVQQSEAASATYQEMVEGFQSGASEQEVETKIATVKHLAEQLKTDHASSLYASQAALYLAKIAVEAGELDQATTELQWVVDAKVDAQVVLLASGRLARVKLAQQDYDAALAVLSAKEQGAFKSTFAEIRGDVMLAKGQQTEARAAYQLALGSLTSAQQPRRQLLQIKLKDLQPAPIVQEQEAPAAEENNS